MNYTELIQSLSPDEYLNFIIDSVFNFYRDKDTLISIYDRNKQLRFTTDRNLKLHGLKPGAGGFSGVDPLKTGKFLNDHLLSAIDCVLSQKTNVTGLVIARFPTFAGAMYITLTPLYYKDEVCGILLKKNISTRLLYSMTPITKQNMWTEKLIIKPEYLKSLSERECAVLFLGALNYSMPAIAKLLAISQGTVRTYITRVCDKLYIPNSLTYIQKSLEKRLLLNSLSLPNIKFRPIVVLTSGDDEHFLTTPSYDLICEEMPH